MQIAEFLCPEKSLKCPLCKLGLVYPEQTAKYIKGLIWIILAEAEHHISPQVMCL